jgi:MFS family permease
MGTEKQVSFYSWYALALLTFVYVLNFLDRQIVYILFPSIKKDFSFSDIQLSLFGATAFVIFYTVLGIPFGRIADKVSRKKMIAFGLAVWSLFSGLTGFAVGFKTLFFCRVMVGVGEATLGPAAFSLLADYFPFEKRATVSSIYSMGIALGAGLAALSGGFIVGWNWGWRWAFYLLGFPGIFFAVLVFLLREEPRGNTETEQVNYSSNDWKLLLTNRSLIFHFLGYALLGLATNNLSIWGVTFYSRLHKFDIATIGFWGGILTIAAGIPATLFGGYIADIFRRRNKGGRMLYSSLLAFVSIPFWLLVLQTSNVYLILLANFVLLAAALGWVGAAAADVTEIAGVNLRGLGIAIFFFAVNVSAYLIGSNLIAKLNDIFSATQNPAAMRYTLLVCPLSCAMSALMLYLGSRKLNQQR